MVSNKLREFVESCSEIPSAWRASDGQLTEDQSPALFPSNRHASMAIRIAYLADLKGAASEIAETRARYLDAQRIYEGHCRAMTSIVKMMTSDNSDGALTAWAGVGQSEVNDAFRTVLGEREEVRGNTNLVTVAWRHFELGPGDTKAYPKHLRDRPLRERDSNEAWERADNGACNGCGLPTISPRQRRQLHALLQKAGGQARLTEMYDQQNGKPAPLWPVVTIAAKGVAEHVIARSRGGPTGPSNLTNSCAGCNYTRSDSRMHTAGVAGYRRLL